MIVFKCTDSVKVSPMLYDELKYPCRAITSLPLPKFLQTYPLMQDSYYLTLR